MCPTATGTCRAAAAGRTAGPGTTCAGAPSRRPSGSRAPGPRRRATGSPAPAVRSSRRARRPAGSAGRRGRGASGDSRISTIGRPVGRSMARTRHRSLTQMYASSGALQAAHSPASSPLRGGSTATGSSSCLTRRSPSKGNDGHWVKSGTEGGVSGTTLTLTESGTAVPTCLSGPDHRIGARRRPGCAWPRGRPRGDIHRLPILNTRPSSTGSHPLPRAVSRETGGACGQPVWITFRPVGRCPRARRRAARRASLRRGSRTAASIRARRTPRPSREPIGPIRRASDLVPA